jgi:hypothetical protein
MEAEIEIKTDDLMIINWSGTKGFGQLTVKHEGQGIYTVDSECMSMDTVMKIFKAIEP